VQLLGPQTHYLYHGYGKLEWAGSPLRTFRHIGVLAYGAAITGAYALIDSLMPNYDSRTGLSLLWVGQQPEDFVFLEEFSTLAEQQRLNFNLMLESARPGWIGPYGQPNASHLSAFLPPPGEDTALMLLGGAQIAPVLPILEELGYQHILKPRSLSDP
jgi:NAD(P)H-flavin reductase